MSNHVPDGEMPTVLPTASAEASPPEPQTSAPEVPPPPPPGTCLKCGTEVDLRDTFPPPGQEAGPDVPKLHQLGPDRARGRPFSKVCGPVATEFLYSVFIWGPEGPFRLTMTWPRPVEGKAIPVATAAWAAALSAQVKVVDEKGAPIIGEKVRFVVEHWAPIGARR